MQSSERIYDVVIIGGGLAGLSLSIQLAKKGFDVLLFEKETYPFMRVCGEYISMESWEFIKRLGLDLEKMQLPKINKIFISSPSGKSLSQELDMGGFGISRYLLDHKLSIIARREGVTVREGNKVEDVIFDSNRFTILTHHDQVTARVVVAAFGKRSNLDVKWGRKFILKKTNKLNNYIGVKYHIKTNHPSDVIALHNFQDGYCGISKVEDEKYCLCYLTTAANLKKHKNSIKEMELEVLQKNPFLKSIFESSEFLVSSPVTIAQISFDKKSPVENHILMVGDAAGMIAPLCGNGMSMAFNASKLAFNNISCFLDNVSGRLDMEREYTRGWQNLFANRLKAGRIIQMLFGKEVVTNLTIRVLKKLPKAVDKIIRLTHGKPF